MAPDGEIRASRWHIVRVHLGLLFIAALCGLVWIPEAMGYAKPGETPRPVTAMFIVGGVWLWTLYSAVAVIVNRVRLTPDRAERRNIFGERWVRRSDVVGLRQLGEDILLCTDPKQRDGLTVPKAVIDHPVWVAWLEGLRNLDVEEAQAERAALEADERLGLTADERRSRLAMFRWVDIAVTFAALGALFASPFYWPDPYWLGVVIVGAAPLVLVAVMLRWPILGTVTPSLGILAAAAVLVLALRAAFDVNVLDPWPARLWGGGIGILAGGVVVVRYPDDRTWKNLLIAALVGIPVLIWCVSALNFANLLLDKTPLRLTEVTVVERLGKRKDGPELTVRELDPPHETFKELGISARRFDRSPPGTRACVAVHSGWLGWRLAYVGDCPPRS